MRSVSGVDLVSAALNSSLSKAQKRFNFFNPGSLSKKKLKKEKIIENKLKRKFARFKSPSTQPLLSTQSVNSNDSEWNVSAKNYNPPEFEVVENEFSSFISSLKDKYTCLNPGRNNSAESTVDKINSNGVTPLKKPKKVKVKKDYLKSIAPCSATKPILNSSICSEKDEDADSGLGLEIDSKNTPISYIQQFRLKRLQEKKEKRRKKKKALKEAARLAEEQQKLSKLKETKLKSKRMKDLLSMTESNGTGTNNEKQHPVAILPRPKITLYPREKIVQGWQQRVHHGNGFHNLGNTCYMNATLQALFHTPAFVNWLYNDVEHQQKCRSNSLTAQNCLVCAMQSTLKDSLNRHSGCIRPIQIHNRLKSICKHFHHCRQEDAHEFLRYLLESMERSYLVAINALKIDSRSKETTPLGQIFGGYLRTEVTCLKCNSISTTFQPLAELQLDIRHVTTLEDAINNHFKKERLDNNDYKCEKCHAVSPATKQFSLEVPPIVLCLQLKRFTLSGGKISKPIHCNQRLNMNRFLHKSLRENHANVQYRLVGLITHIGSSPNCGHYTAIAETSSGNFYQFDDSLVRPVPIQHALNTDAYVIIYEMESTPQALKSGSYPDGHSMNFKNGVVSNGIKPSSTITKPTSASPTTTPFEHKKIVGSLVKSNIVENGNGFVKSTTPVPSGGLSKPNGLVNGFSSSLSGLPTKDRTPVSFNLQRTTAITPSGNPKIVFKNPNAVLPSVSTYLGPAARAKLSNETPAPVQRAAVQPSQRDITGGLDKKPTTPLASPLGPTPDSIKDGIKRYLGNNNPSPVIGPKPVVPVKINPERPSKLVAYDSDDDSDSDEPATEPAEAKEPPAKKPSTPPRSPSSRPTSPVKKLFPIFKKSPGITSWSGSENDSALANSLAASRKRSFEKSQDDLYNEELDAGKAKKSRSSKSRSPVRDYPRSQDKSGSGSGTNQPNKFQRFEDDRRSAGEMMQSLQQHHNPLKSNPSTSTSSSTIAPKTQNGFIVSSSGHNGSSDYRKGSDSSGKSADSSRSSSGDSSRSSNHYFAKKGYNFHSRNNYGYNSLKRYSSDSNGYRSFGRFYGYNNNKNYQGNSDGWRNRNNNRVVGDGDRYGGGYYSGGRGRGNR